MGGIGEFIAVLLRTARRVRQDRGGGDAESDEAARREEEEWELELDELEEEGE